MAPTFCSVPSTNTLVQTRLSTFVCIIIFSTFFVVSSLLSPSHKLTLEAEQRFQENRVRVKQATKRKQRERDDVVGHFKAPPKSALKCVRRENGKGHKSTSIKPACTATKTFPSVSSTAQGLTNTAPSPANSPATPNFPPRQRNLPSSESSSDTEEEDEEDLYTVTMAPPKKTVAQSKYDALKKTNTGLEEQIDGLMDKLNQQGMELQKNNIAHETMKSIVGKTGTEAALRADIIKIAEKQGKIIAERDQALKANAEHKKLADTLQKENERLKKKNNKTSALPSVSPEKELNKWQDTKKKLEAKVNALEAKVKAQEAKVKELEGAKKALKEKKKALEKQIKEAKAPDQAEQSAEVKEWKKKHQNVLKELEATKKNVGTLKTQKASLTNSNGRLQEALKTANDELKKSGRGSANEVSKDVDEKAKLFLKAVSIHKTRLVHTDLDSMVMKKIVQPVYEGIKEERRMTDIGSPDELSVDEFGRIYKKSLLACLSEQRSKVGTSLLQAVGGE